jgi:hypothetical protein
VRWAWLSVRHVLRGPFYPAECDRLIRRWTGKPSGSFPEDCWELGGSSWGGDKEPGVGCKIMQTMLVAAGVGTALVRWLRA